MSRREADFWLRAMLSKRDGDSTLHRLQSEPFVDDFSLGSLEGALIARKRKWGKEISPFAIIPMAVLFPLSDLLLMLCRHPIQIDILFAFADLVLPYLSHEERSELRTAFRAPVQKAVSGLGWPIQADQRTLTALIGAFLGCHDELWLLVRSWPDDQFGTAPVANRHYGFAQELIFGLRDPMLVAAEIQRLHIPLQSAYHIRGWFAHTELADLEYVKDCALLLKNEHRAQEMANALGLALTPQTAGYMLEITLAAPSAEKAARKWLESHPELAIQGLSSLIVGHSKLHDAARTYLRGLARSGQQDQALAKLATMNSHLQALLFLASDVPELTEATTPDWLRERTTHIPAAKEKFKLSNLPPLVITMPDGTQARLNVAQVQKVVWAIRNSPETPKAQELLSALRERIAPVVLDRFVWDLVEWWERTLVLGKDKSATKGAWPLNAVAMLGSDTLVARLGDKVTDWSSQKHSNWVYQALNALGNAVNDAALLELHRLAHSLSTFHRREAAHEALEYAAKQRGIALDEIEERLVPNLGINGNGSRIFDYGARQFRLVIAANLTPIVRDESGKPLANLPAPRKTDDPAKVAAAKADWLLLKRQFKEIAKAQSIRLDLAMVEGRRWSQAAFAEAFVRHPVMRHITPLLVWGAYTGSLAPVITFRVGDDGSQTDSRDQPVTLPSDATVGLVHPIRLSEAERAEWRDLFHDYELFQPLAQLDRPLYRLTEEELAGKRITRFGDYAIYPTAAYAGLSRRGWRKTSVTSDRCRHDFPAQPDRPPVSAYALFSWHHSAKGITLPVVVFCTAEVPYNQSPISMALPLREVDPLLLSETIFDLESIFKRAHS